MSEKKIDFIGNHLANMREQLDEALDVIMALINAYDPEEARIPVEPDPGCLLCTAGTTPYDKQTGICTYHRARRLLGMMT